MGSFVSRALIMALGYAYPAYECSKTVQRNDPEEIEQFQFWCQYWILIAILTIVERIGDAFVSWLPMYNILKLAFIVYLWHPKWKGTTLLYNSFFQPYVITYEKEIDRNLVELKLRAGEVGSDFRNRAISYWKTWLLKILQNLSSQKEALESHVDQQKQTLRINSSKASVTKPEQFERDNIVPQSGHKMVLLAQSPWVETSSEGTNM